MQIINTFAQVLRFWEMGMPSRLLLPVTFLLFAAFHGFLRWGTDGRGRWLPILLAAAIFGCQAAIWLIVWLLHSYLAMLVVVVLCYLEAALLGTGLGEVLYRLWKRAERR